MHRCGSGFLLKLAIIFVFSVALTSCLGKSTGNAGNGGVTSITLSPGGTISIDVGATQVFSASGKNATGGTVLGINIQFVVGVPTGVTAAAPLSIANNGNACAGTWDPTATICSPGNPGIAIVQAVTNGVFSPATTVYIHQHVDSIQIVNAAGQPPQYECFSQGQTWQFEAIPYSGNPPQDISNTVGPMTWSSSNFGVVTTAPTLSGNPGSQVNLVQTTAATPGITQLVASVAGTSSTPYSYTTCLVKAIYLQIAGQGQAGNSTTVNNGGSANITATAVDTLYGIANTTPLAKPPLTWSTTNPEVAAFASTTNTTGSNSATARNNLGGAIVTASCSPPTCNIGLPGLTPSGTIVPSLPVYASNGVLPNGTNGYGAISLDVTLASSSKEPTYTGWAATTGCNDQSGCSSALFAVTPGTTPISSIVSLPRTPNSMMFNHLSTARVYLGSDQGLMYVDVGGTNPSAALVSNSPIPCNVSLCGKVLTISNDGKLVVVSDPPAPPTPGQVYIYNAGSTSTAPVDLTLSNASETATAASFSPDQLKLFIFTDAGNMYIYSTVDALTLISTFAPGTDVVFSADGSFAYVAEASANSVSAYSTCSLPNAGSVEIGSVATSSTPLQIFPSPVVQADPLGLTQNIIALEPPNIEFLTAQQFTQVPIPYSVPLQFTCNHPTIQSFTKGASFNLGQGNFNPIYSQLVADGTEVIILARHLPAVLLFNVSNGTTTSVPLARQGFGITDPIAAASSTDGSQVYVAACDQYPNNDPTQSCAAGSVHIVCANNACTTGQGDYQQVPYMNINQANNPNMCNSQGGSAPLCLPNLIAIRPQ